MSAAAADRSRGAPRGLISGHQKQKIAALVIGHQRRVGKARANRRDFDVVPFQVNRHTLHQCYNRRFAGTVGARLGQPDGSGQTGDGDQMSLIPLDHRGQKRADRVDHTDHIGLDDLRSVLGRKVAGGRIMVDARIRDHDIARTERRQQGGSGGLHLREVGHVRRRVFSASSRASDFADKLLKQLSSPGDESDCGAAPRQMQRKRPANAAAGAGDEDALPGPVAARRMSFIRFQRGLHLHRERIGFRRR